MAKKKADDSATSLAKRIVQSLELRRAASSGYPASLREVARDVGFEVSEFEVRAALAKPPLKSGCILSVDGDLDSLAVLNETADIERLVGDERLLRTLCENLCSPQLPIISVKEIVAAGLLAKKLNKPFTLMWEGRIKSGDLPPFVEVVSVPGKTAKSSTNKLHDVRFPLPWLSLSRDLVQAMQPSGDAEGLIVEWSTLAGRVPGADHKAYAVLARTSEPFQSQVIPVFAKEPGGWLVLIANAERSASDPRILDRVYRATLKKGDTAVDVAALKKQKLLSPHLTAAFTRVVDQMASQCPEGFGVVRLGKKSILFRLRDVPGGSWSHQPSAVSDQPAQSGSPLPARPTEPQRADEASFERAFQEAFGRLDANDGGYNFVKILHLRSALPQYTRMEFDAGLHGLRLARRFSLVSSEGNAITLTDQEREAGILEAGTRLVYCKQIV